VLILNNEAGKKYLFSIEMLNGGIPCVIQFLLQRVRSDRKAPEQGLSQKSKYSLAKSKSRKGNISI
jgi:hypothetical protein